MDLLESPPQEAEAATALLGATIATSSAATSGLAGTAHARLQDVLLLGALSMFGSVAMDMYLPALPRLASALHASPGAAQATISVFLVGLAGGQLVYGPLSDRIGRRAPILLGVAVYLAASAALALSATIEAMIAARFLQGLGACAGMVVARAVVRDRYEDHEVLYIYSLLSLVFGVAPIVAPLIGGWVLAVADWRWIFGVQALFGVVVGVWAFFGLPETRSEATRSRTQSENPIASYLALLRQPRLVGCVATAALAGAALFAYITAAPEVVITQFHVPPERFGWLFGFNSIGMIAAGQLNARIARRVPGRALLRGGLYVALAFGLILEICAATGFGGLWGVLTPLFFVLGSFGFTQANASTAAMSVDRHRAGATAAILGASFFGVGGLAGLALDVLHEPSARPMATVILGSTAFAIASFHGLMDRTRPR